MWIRDAQTKTLMCDWRNCLVRLAKPGKLYRGSVSSMGVPHQGMGTFVM